MALPSGEKTIIVAELGQKVYVSAAGYFARRETNYGNFFGFRSAFGDTR